MKINDIEVKDCAGSVLVKWHLSGMLPPTIEMTPDEAVHVAIEMQSVAARIIADQASRRMSAGKGNGGTITFASLAGEHSPDPGEALTINGGEPPAGGKNDI